MKNFISKLAIILLVCLVRLVFAQSDFSRDFKVMRVPQGKIISIALNANPTTGFSWRLVSISDKNVLEFVKKEFFSAKEKLAGVGGVEKWSFKTLKSGQATIILEYIREWEKDVPAAKREEFSVFVK
ncbi:MAG: protease inhibitor I42 family protein [Candidatus Omnitrophica bacterium]|nr:protease inhibitor I42 family protein [Candidatus Omnitrophota bacterium]MBU1923583.1 protease inhibitor I42 family protein [Candidatus Omnitrophota bacterium]